MIRAILALAAATLLAVAALFALAPAQTSRAQAAQNFDDIPTYTLKHNGVERIFGLYVPESYEARGAQSMIVALHGRFSSAKALHALSQLRAVADARGAILLYPQSTGRFWGDGGHAALGRTTPAPDDVGYITTLMNMVAEDYRVDRDKIFLLGYDNGGGPMAYRLACEQPVRFAGVAVVAALMWQFTADNCRPPNPTPLLIIHGRDSEAFPAGGLSNEGSLKSARLSATETIDFWRTANGCASGPTCAPVVYVGIAEGLQNWPLTGANYTLNRHGVDAAAAIDGFFFNRAGFTPPSVQSNPHRTRDYIVYVPHTYDARKPTPVMLMLHGRPMTGAEMAATTDMNSIADKFGFIVVYPNGIEKMWNAQFDLYTKSERSVRTSGVEREGVTMQDDVAFLKTLMKDLNVDLNIDTGRIYVAGYSNGGFMSMRLACTESDTFAGFAEVGSSIYPVMMEFCKRGRPAPMVFIHGTEDKSVPISGVYRRTFDHDIPTRVTLSARETVALFAERNGCEPTGTLTKFAQSGRSPGTTLTRYTPKNCRADAPIDFYIIEGGGHTWPGVDTVKLGLVNMDMHASETIWTFLSKHRLPPSTPAPPGS